MECYYYLLPFLYLFRQERYKSSVGSFQTSDIVKPVLAVEAQRARILGLQVYLAAQASDAAFGTPADSVRI